MSEYCLLEKNCQNLGNGLVSQTMGRQKHVAQSQRSLWADLRPDSRLPKPVASEPESLLDLASPKRVVEKLSEIDWSFTNEDTRYLSHDLHPYPAKFIPQIPANLVRALSLRGEVVWDPFGGCGTTALESLFMGRRAVSTDLNELATLITSAKCTSLSPEQREEIRGLSRRVRMLSAARDIEEILAKTWEKSKKHVPPIPNLQTWFCPVATRELAFLREEINTISDCSPRVFALVVFSSIIVAVSNQDSETRYARRERDAKEGDVLRLFSIALDNSLMRHEQTERFLGYRTAVVRTVDVGQIDRSDILAPESVDLVVTSPPYANSTDYHLYHRFRLFWLGFDPRNLAKREIGSHLRHQREKRGFDLYEEEMSEALGQILTRIRPGRYAALILGDSVFDGALINASSTIMGLAEDMGYEIVGNFRRPVHPTKRSFIPPARRTKTEDILVLRKRPRRLRLFFYPPSYRMWPYENELRKREVQSLLGARPRKEGEKLLVNLDCHRVDLCQRLAFTSTVTAAGGVPSWRTWQSQLENGNSKSARKDPKYLTHGIHSYKGKFYPQLAKSLLNLANLALGAAVLDPFCGSGTVLLEAQLGGFSATGFDLNPLALLISRAKTVVTTENATGLDHLIKEFHDRIVSDRSKLGHIDFFPSDLHGEIRSWFPLPVAGRLGWLMSEIERVPNTMAALVLKVLLSNIIRQVSHQEPKDLRIRRRKEPIRDAPVIDLFRARINVFRERLRHFGERVSASPNPMGAANIVDGDSRKWETFRPWSNRPFQCVVTSPPYATALPYIDTDRLSLLVILGISCRESSQIESHLIGSREIRNGDRKRCEAQVESDLFHQIKSKTAGEIIREIFRLNSKANVGFRRKNLAALLVRYFGDMWSTFQNLARVIEPGARLFFVIGDNTTVAGTKRVVIRSTQAFVEMGRANGWQLEDRIPISVTREAPLHSRNAITENTVLCFRAPR